MNSYISRGAFAPGRGDLCGTRFQAGLAKKAATPDAVRNTVNAVREEPVELVKVPGGRMFAIPAEVFNYLTGERR